MTGLCLGGQPASHPKELCSRPWVHCSSVGNESLAASLTSVGARVWQGCPGQDWNGQATARPGHSTYHGAPEHHPQAPCFLPVLSGGGDGSRSPSSCTTACTSGITHPGPASTVLPCSHPPCTVPSQPHGSTVWVLGDLQLVAPGSASLPPSTAPRAGRKLHLSLSLLKGPISSAGSPGCSASSSSCWHSSAAATAAASPVHVIPVPLSLGSCHGPPLPVGRGALGARDRGVPRGGCSPHRALQPVVGARGSPYPPPAVERGRRAGVRLPAKGSLRRRGVSPAPPSRRRSRSNRL